MPFTHATYSSLGRSLDVDVGRPGRTEPGISQHDHVVVDAIDAGLLVLRFGRLDDLVDGGEETEPTEPPKQPLGRIDVLTIEIEGHLGSNSVVPHGVDVLDELLGGDWWSNW
eukprot:CAMPEP_0181040386 /NCGR_PEP_ID=MMETSP1070-20121207/11019_1 /TAXON_ID=265543 /ORGANISM="Minutocellus polymorphus, Strain NH13" /LENGTH=111 /DNA_ID=CAMNT_0023118389 /DNA_START=325 /DNA_END=657 /DNA_ORIENTATION=-